MTSLQLLALGTVALVAGCGADDDGPAPCIAPGPDAEAALQTAFIEAMTGDVICLEAGTFSIRGELDLDADGVTVRGAGADATILDYSGQDTGAQGMLVRGDDVTIEDLQVADTAGDGITAEGVTNVTFRNVTVGWEAAASTDNGAYGLYPVSSTGVTIEGCTVHGARDAGIYVGQSTDIRVQDNEARGNVAGIEIENSTDAIVRGNHAHDNTAGILIFNLPALPVQGGARANVFDNTVVDNDLPNFAEAGTIVSVVPPGTGVLLLASDDNEIHDNVVTGNDSAGILVLSWLDALFGPANDPSFDPYPQGNWIHDNTMSDNGTAPDLSVDLLVDAEPIPDIVWDGCTDPDVPNEDGAATNCISDNGDAGWLNVDVCGEGNESQDPAPVTCEHEPLPTE
jgi:parallel beta-helix repeat protein